MRPPVATLTPSASVLPGVPPRVPHPGFPALVALHLRSLVREFPVAWIVFGIVIVGLPVLALVVDMGVTPRGTPSFGIVRVVSAIWGAQALTLLVALLWPDAVWRNLPPGGRQAMDALPVDRRWHRLARVLAGFTLPLLLALTILITKAIVASRLSGIVDPGVLPPGSEGRTMTLSLAAGLGAWWITPPALAIAYLFGSALGLWGLRVMLTSLLAVLLYAFAPVALLLGFGLDGMANGYIETVVQGTWSPLRVTLASFRAEAADLLPVLGWLAVMGGACHILAGRHSPR
jgi:hypothetical protein